MSFRIYFSFDWILKLCLYNKYKPENAEDAKRQWKHWRNTTRDRDKQNNTKDKQHKIKQTKKMRHMNRIARNRYAQTNHKSVLLTTTRFKDEQTSFYAETVAELIRNK